MPIEAYGLLHPGYIWRNLNIIIQITAYIVYAQILLVLIILPANGCVWLIQYILYRRL